MLFKLFGWVPVIFGLKVAGITSAVPVPEVGTSERPAWIAASTPLNSVDTETAISYKRVSSGSIVTKLADEPVQSRSFVMRPLPVNIQRPLSRLKNTMTKPVATARYIPGQVTQSNRPAPVADLKRSGKKVTKRVVTLQSRRAVVHTGDNVIAFPIPTARSTTKLMRAA